MNSDIFQGDCRDVLRDFPDDHFDSVVCDPPYELGFMGRKWDSNGIAYDMRVWSEVFRVMKPGAYLAAFGGTRTYHRMACAIEDAGFEIRDSLHWIYGSGFPKSLDVSKAIDKAAGAEREVTGEGQPFGRNSVRNRARVEMGWRKTEVNPQGGVHQVTSPATDAARQWNGWGTALKPAHEPIVVARKPLAGTVAANVLEYGTGALNIDGCRVEGPAGSGHWIRNGEMGTRGIYGAGGQSGEDFGSENPAGGRWPPNILLTHSTDCQPAGSRKIRGGSGTNGKPGGNNVLGAQSRARPRSDFNHADADGTETVQAWDCVPGCPVAGMDAQSGTLKTSAWNGQQNGPKFGDQYGAWETRESAGHPASEGGASRFFPQFTWDPEYDMPFMYCAKAPGKERPKVDGISHATVKPLALMRWLVRLVTPPEGTLLDPFAGTGTTGQAAREEGFGYVLIEREPDYIKLINKRLYREPSLFDMEDA